MISKEYVITKLTNEQSSELIEIRSPIGRFYTKVGNLYIGIDNSTGDAWTEEFKSKASCNKWLEGNRVRDARGQWLN